MTKRTTFAFKTLHVLSWIVFVGLGIQAGGFISKTVATLMLSPEAASKFWREIDLSSVYAYSQNYFIAIALLIIIVTLLKALMFYFIIKIFSDKALNVSKPFDEKMRRFILNKAYLTLAIGLFSSIGARVADKLIKYEVKIPAPHELKLAGADIWIFMGIVLLVIAAMFKKGVALQNENDLTV